MNHTRTWTDMYGSACASFEGRAGGHIWLVAAPPDLAAAVPAQLEGVDGKGTVELLVHEGLTPLLATAREMQPRGVLIVAPEAFQAGPAVTVEARTVEHAENAAYQEGGAFPAWTAAEPQSGSAQGECPAASAVASLELPVRLATPGTVREILEAWMDATPHGR